MIGEIRSDEESTIMCKEEDVLPSQLKCYIYIWDSVQLNHPYGTFSKFPETQKKSNARIEMYG